MSQSDLRGLVRRRWLDPTVRFIRSVVEPRHLHLKQTPQLMLTEVALDYWEQYDLEPCLLGI